MPGVFSKVGARRGDAGRGAPACRQEAEAQGHCALEGQQGEGCKSVP